MRAKAVQAFWAMHVEALNWSGGNAAVYARVHRLDPTSLRLWRRRFDAEPLAFDWRARLHPRALPRTSPLPKISTGVSSAAKEPPAESPLTEVVSIVPTTDRRANRRRFTDAEKLAIVQKADASGATAAAICRRHGIVTSMLFRWRVQFGFGQNERAKLAAVQVEGQHSNPKRVAPAAPFLLHDLLPVPDGMAAVELSDGRRVFAPVGSNPAAVRQFVKDKEAVR